MVTISRFGMTRAAQLGFGCSGPEIHQVVILFLKCVEAFVSYQHKQTLHLEKRFVNDQQLCVGSRNDTHSLMRVDVTLRFTVFGCMQWLGKESSTTVFSGSLPNMNHKAAGSVKIWIWQILEKVGGAGVGCVRLSVQGVALFLNCGMLIVLHNACFDCSGWLKRKAVFITLLVLKLNVGQEKKKTLPQKHGKDY